MLIPIALGAAALYGLYRYEQSKNTVTGAAAAAPPPPPAGTPPAATVPATNSMGSISYHPAVIVPGFNTPLAHVAVPPAPSGTTYPAATTVTDPNKTGMSGPAGRVAGWQAATPTPSSVYYYPDPGDSPYMVPSRLGGTSKARLTLGKAYITAHPEDILKTLPLTDLGKLNGIVSDADFVAWFKAGKPLMLPLGGYSDVSGPVPLAMGTIR